MFKKEKLIELLFKSSKSDWKLISQRIAPELSYLVISLSGVRYDKSVQWIERWSNRSHWCVLSERIQSTHTIGGYNRWIQSMDTIDEYSERIKSMDTNSSLEDQAVRSSSRWLIASLEFLQIFIFVIAIRPKFIKLKILEVLQRRLSIAPNRF